MKKTEFIYETPELTVVFLLNEGVVCASVIGAANDPFIDDDDDDLWR